jgi:hypothetical protein
MGESVLGDISRYKQLQGAGINKGMAEKAAIKQMVKSLDKMTAREIINMFEDFELPPEKMNNPETILAKLIDSLQGDQFCLTFGNNLAENSEIIGKIVYKHTVPYAMRLREILIEKGKNKAAGEVGEIIKLHIKTIRKAGIKIPENFSNSAGEEKQKNYGDKSNGGEKTQGGKQ